MSERGILFTPGNILKVENSSKTQTRRIVKLTASGRIKLAGSPKNWHPDDPDAVQACPSGMVGDRLYVKEGFCVGRPALPSGRGIIPHYGPLSAIHDPIIKYKRDWGEIDPPKWRSPLFMPKWAARLWLEITEVRVERLQDMEGQVDFESDALAEGVNSIHHGDGNYYYSAFRNEPHPKNWVSASDAFKELWESINGPGSWDINPFVWVLSYRKAKP